MNETFTGTEKLGDIVLKFPQAAEIFKTSGIDFCCGGEQILSVATVEHGIEISGILHRLNQGYDEAVQQGREFVDWMSVPLHQLIDHIINTHHAYLHQVFSPLTELVTKIRRVHWQHHGEGLSQLLRLFSTLRMDMEEHMIQEEEIVFPWIVDYEKNPTVEKLERVIRAVEELDKDHDGAGDTIKKIRQVTDGFRLPEDACGTYAYTFQKLEELESDVFQHIHLENNVLFVRLQNERKNVVTS